MAKEEKYTSEFKVKVAKAALAQQKMNLDKLSDKFGVPVSQILTWTVQLEKNGPEFFETEAEEEKESSEHFQEEESHEVDVEDSKFARSLSYGVMTDELNYKKLLFWSVLGVVLLIIFVRALMEMYQFNVDITKEKVAETEKHYKVNQLREQADKKLDSFGVVNLDEGIYHIPIDSAMKEIAESNNN